ncbi:HpcH/HpaI aldolase family protein [Shumkonia mesophila]|uniref:HpcH/HpaI aldolase family protein n=1 Tax=Shumkonia mesophila TaxID=2838854 RepID=UPI0029351BBC|nr:aldolase/citrate lyase family protein [Shumkonia mesophila]
MSEPSLRQRLLSHEFLLGLFVKTPAHEVIEVLALSGIDFVCLDSEHAAFDRARLDLCLAMAKAIGLPSLVRVSHAAAAPILQALDAGAAGVVVPHVDSVEKAHQVARWAHYGIGGRGYAGTTRMGGFGTRPRTEVLDFNRTQNIVIAQIEDPSGVDAVDEIAAVDGIDALFIGKADLTVGYGAADQNAEVVEQAYDKIVAAGRKAGKPVAGVIGGVKAAASVRERGISMGFVGTDHSLILNGAKAIAALKQS